MTSAFGLNDRSPREFAQAVCACGVTHQSVHFFTVEAWSLCAAEQTGPVSKIIEVFGRPAFTFGMTKKS